MKLKTQYYYITGQYLYHTNHVNFSQYYIHKQNMDIRKIDDGLLCLQPYLVHQDPKMNGNRKDE